MATTHPSHYINMMANDSIVHNVIGRHVWNNHVQYRIVFAQSIAQNSWENESIVLTITDTVLLLKVSVLDCLVGIQAKSIWRETNACYDTYKLFLQNNCNSARNQRARNCRDGTFKRGGCIKQIAEYICCHCTIDNGEFLYLVGWGDWRKNDSSWISHQDLIHCIRVGDYVGWHLVRKNFLQYYVYLRQWYVCLSDVCWMVTMPRHNTYETTL